MTVQYKGKREVLPLTLEVLQRKANTFDAGGNLDTVEPVRLGDGEASAILAALHYVEDNSAEVARREGVMNTTFRGNASLAPSDRMMEVLQQISATAEDKRVFKMTLNYIDANILMTGLRLRQRLNDFKTSGVKGDLTDRLALARDEPGCSMLPLLTAEATMLLCLVSGAGAASRSPETGDLYIGRNDLGNHLWRDPKNGVIYIGDEPAGGVETGVKLPPAAQDQSMLATVIEERDRARNLLNSALHMIEMLIEDRG